MSHIPLPSLNAVPKAWLTELRGLLFDLDDTLLEHGRLLPEALQALYALSAAGYRLFAVTGRPAAWGAIITHQWPIDGAVTENGAIALCRRDGPCRSDARDRSAEHAKDRRGRVVISDVLDVAARTARRARLLEIVGALSREFPELEPSDDVWQRVSDYTFDIGEYRHVSADVVAKARQSAARLGASTIASSVHLHVSLDRADKATGTLRLLRELFGADPMEALAQYAFIGDSDNDAACFSAFRLTFGVRNWTGRPTLPPRFVTAEPRARGFVEVARLLLSART
ncbi:MAG TPA: HAD hydrolase family protein [Polyangiaceae bacterium]|nr:HAD hydrolase family protein [Polyangiaceae bacterium]